MKTTFVPAVCSALALAATVSAQGATQSTVMAQANQAYGLEQSSIQSLVPQGGLDTAVRVAVDLDGQTAVLRLSAHSVRSDDFRLLTQIEDGSIVEIDAPQPRTLRGDVVGFEGSQVAASWLDDGLYARIRLSDQSEYWVQPIVEQVPTADPSQHVVYQSDDVSPVAGMCGTDLLSNAQQNVPTANTPGPTTQLGSTLYICELGVDADFEYYQEEGSNTTSTQNQIDAVINTMNMQYENEVDITHQITTTIIRTTSADPYSSTNSSTLLNQFVNEWNSNQGGIQRDVAHLFTGKSIQGGVIGIAYLGVICHGSLGYGLVESNFNNNFSCATDLSAHELGHNWNADHCTCTSFTMNPFITCANTFSSSLTRPDIIAHRNSRNCLDTGTPTPLDITFITPSTIDALIPGISQTISIFGSGFTPTTTVSVDGVAQGGFPSNVTYVNSSLMTMDMPQVPALGSVSISADDGSSTDSMSITVQAPSSPKLQVGDGELGTSIFSASGIPVTVSGTPGNIHLVVYSKSNVPSLSSFVNLDLGNNFAQVPYLNPFVISPVSGWDTRLLTPASVPAFTTFYFQSVDVTTGSFPLDVSNFQEILIIF